MRDRKQWKIIKLKTGNAEESQKPKNDVSSCGLPYMKKKTPCLILSSSTKAPFPLQSPRQQRKCHSAVASKQDERLGTEATDRNGAVAGKSRTMGRGVTYTLQPLWSASGGFGSDGRLPGPPTGGLCPRRGERSGRRRV